MACAVGRVGVQTLLVHILLPVMMLALLGVGPLPWVFVLVLKVPFLEVCEGEVVLVEVDLPTHGFLDHLKALSGLVAADLTLGDRSVGVVVVEALSYGSLGLVKIEISKHALRPICIHLPLRGPQTILSHSGFLAVIGELSHKSEKGRAMTAVGIYRE